MRAHRYSLAFVPVALLLSACTEPTGEITRDTEPFGAIDEAASVSLLGTEPFWSLDVEPAGEGYEARYSTPENIEGTAFTATRFAGNNGLGFSGMLDGEAVTASLTPGSCSDAMSDRTYPYIATVRIGERTLRGCGYTSDEPYTGDEAP